MGWASFGQTSLSKEQLYLEEIFGILKAFPGMDYDGAMRLPIPIRKWLIQRHNKFMEQTAPAPQHQAPQGSQSKPLPQQPPSDEPLSPAQKAKMRNQIAQMQGDPGGSMQAFHRGAKS